MVILLCITSQNTIYYNNSFLKIKLLFFNLIPQHLICQRLNLILQYLIFFILVDNNKKKKDKWIKNSLTQVIDFLFLRII